MSGAHVGRIDAQQLVPPQGVIEYGDWLSVSVGDIPVRTLIWSRHPVTDKLSVQVSGYQYGDTGRIEWDIAISGPDGAIEDLTVAEARRLAHALLAAADQLERLR